MDSSQNQNHVAAAEAFGTVPKSSAPFGNIPQDAEGFRTVQQVSDRKENHTLTVREVARLFEAAGVARSERSIVNWCQHNVLGVGKLDAYFDPNERKYFITPQSVDLAIAEEKAKAAKHGTVAEAHGNIPQSAERSQPHASPEPSVGDTSKLKALEAEVMDLKITNRAKDQFIDHLKQERAGMLEQLTTSAKRVGELETRLLQLKQPDAEVAPPR